VEKYQNQHLMKLMKVKSGLNCDHVKWVGFDFDFDFDFDFVDDDGEGKGMEL
jgi:hypothetical protein